MFMARPSDYTEELANKICKLIEEGNSLKKIGEMDGMPTRATIHNWLLDEDKKSFFDNYEKAVNIRTENMFDELNEIADTVLPEETNKARLRVDTRKWYLSKVMPKKYGDKLDVTSGNKPIPMIDLTKLSKEHESILNSNSNEEDSETE